MFFFNSAFFMANLAFSVAGHRWPKWNIEHKGRVWGNETIYALRYCGFKYKWGDLEGKFGVLSLLNTWFCKNFHRRLVFNRVHDNYFIHEDSLSHILSYSSNVCLSQEDKNDWRCASIEEGRIIWTAGGVRWKNRGNW